MQNPDENPDLPMDFKNLYEKPKSRNLCKTFVISKKKSRTLGKKIYSIG
jgi:hypothetical protein